MITLRKVEIKQDADESPNTSDIGEYTNSRSDWAICRACGEYVALHAEADCLSRQFGITRTEQHPETLLTQERRPVSPDLRMGRIEG